MGTTETITKARFVAPNNLAWALRASRPGHARQRRMIEWGLNLREVTQPGDRFRRYEKIVPHEFYVLVLGRVAPRRLARWLWRRRGAAIAI